ncbi:patatin-like phospholipase family protein [Grimontia sp. NTOU-MAR1]|uniref:patatin-like phospholipase family protein n=1 Tax=Grimontia sp. NTOU-MAR1 TaxID=3111011 RepID=UPI002DB9AD77|nr:patatin-like phospholipase family protein [Grimontia sp. NTOU-MAR1]WRV98097.1 patatin-like phospholipase family protein [Grimontia sp. NTOU-MAR1]
MQSPKDTDLTASFPSKSVSATPTPTQTKGRKKRIALVAQGGGQRGVFTSGVLDSFLDAGFDPFELYIGTSAGALNLASYITRQYGFGHHFITQYTTQDRFFNLMKYVRRQQFMDLDWALEMACPDHPEGLRVENARDTLVNRTAYACATNSHTLEPNFFRMFEDDWLNVMKATCAIPMLYPKAIRIADQFYVDGGVTGAIPAREAFNRGADIIVVIRTEPVAVDKTLMSAVLTENFRGRMEKRLPDYLARLNIEDRIEKLSEFHHQLAHRLEGIRERYRDKAPEPLWQKFREMIHQKNQNGGRWLFGGDSIYRLHALTGQKLNADMLEMLTRHFQTYQDAIEFMSHPPVRTELIQLAPKQPLSSSALLSKPFQLEHDYQDGLVTGRLFVDEYAAMLSEVSTVTR